MSAKETDNKAAAGAGIIVLVLECVEIGSDSSLGGLPSGHLYAQVMALMSIEAYYGMISVLKAAQFITETDYLLTITDRGRKYAHERRRD